MGYWDIYPPLVKSDRSYSLAEMRQLTIDAIKPLGPDYGRIFADASAKRWMDPLPRQGKASGAYMQPGAYDVHPYLLLNLSDKYDGLTTYAHEWGHELVTVAIQREWTLNLGQRSAYERLAHLLTELYLRLDAVRRARDGRCDFPLTQNDLADATGLTSVHVNRTLQELRRDALIELERKQLHIRDLKRMMDVAMFNPNYLHLDHEGRHLNANS